MEFSRFLSLTSPYYSLIIAYVKDSSEKRLGNVEREKGIEPFATASNAEANGLGRYIVGAKAWASRTGGGFAGLRLVQLLLA